MKNYKWLIWLLFGIILTLMVSCATLMLPSDMNNPCKTGPSNDPVECEYWKKNFPREYKNYLKRMEQHEKSGRQKRYEEKHNVN